MGVKLQEKALGKHCLGEQARPLVSLRNTRDDMMRKRYSSQNTELLTVKICSAVTQNGHGTHMDTARHMPCVLCVCH